MPCPNRSRIRENSSSTPRSCSVATSLIFRKSGRPIWLTQTTAHTAASNTSHALMRHQRKPTRHLRQKPDCISRGVRRNREKTVDELVERERKNKCPALAIERDGGHRSVRGAVRDRVFRAEIQGKFFAAFEFDAVISRLLGFSPELLPVRSRCLPDPAGGGQIAEAVHGFLDGRRIIKDALPSLRAGRGRPFVHAVTDNRMRLFLPFWCSVICAATSLVSLKFQMRRSRNSQPDRHPAAVMLKDYCRPPA